MLIGVTGRVGEGKTTIAKYLKDRYDFSILSFSTPAKRAVAGLFGIPMAHLLDAKLKEKIVPEWNKTARRILQIFGTECMRNHFGLDFWVKLMEKELTWKKAKSYIVIDDVRFQNEFDLIYKHNGKMIQVIRPDNPYQIEQTHISEQIASAVPPSIEIINDGSLQALNSKIDGALLTLCTEKKP